MTGMLAYLRDLFRPKATQARPRRLRGTCPVCGKSLAVIASTGALWKHRGRPAEETQA